MSTFNPKSFNTYVARPLPKSVSALLGRPKPPQWAISLVKRKAQQHDRWRVEGTPFLVGQKKVYLPKFRVTFLRTPSLSPSWAQFEVPLHFNKLDMRDYLFHAYNVTTKTIRSFVPPVRVERRTNVSKPAQRRRYRPLGIKKMTVELEKPFVWPNEPEDYRPWDQERWRESMEKPRNKAAEIQLKGEEAIGRNRVKSHESEGRIESGVRKGKAGSNERAELRKTAEDLLSGKKKWGTIDPHMLPKPHEVKPKGFAHR